MHTFTLANGLRCVVARRADSAMATVNVLYDVGARDENRTLTGMAHLFEHLMFGGSINVPDFDTVLQNAGGVNNAWTSNDFTNFYDTLPAHNIETALYLESDRMLELAFSERVLEVQRSVVIEEFKQTHLNKPYGDSSHRLRRMMYAAEHPYSWPTIGLEPEHIAKVKLSDVRDWFYKHYAPNNAILSIVAPQPFDELETLVHKWFDDIPFREIAQRSLCSPGAPLANVREVVKTDVPQPRITIAYPMAKYGTEEYFAADTITDILANSRSCRINRNLIFGPESGLFAAADASIMGSEDEGMLLLTATLNDSANTEKDVERAIELLTNELYALTQAGNISKRELDTTLNTFEAIYRIESLDANRFAAANAQALYHGEEPEAMLAARRRFTPELLAKVADNISSRPSATLIYLPS